MTTDLGLQTTINLTNYLDEVTDYKLVASLDEVLANIYCSATISNHEFDETHTDKDLMNLASCLVHHLKDAYRDEYGIDFPDCYTRSMVTELFDPGNGFPRSRLVKIEQVLPYSAVGSALPAVSFHVLFPNTASYDRSLGDQEAAQ